MTKTVESAEVAESRQLGGGDFWLKLKSPVIAKAAKPGQFVNIRLTETFDPLLCRPLSIADADKNTGSLTIIYRVVGRGTEKLSKLKAGMSLDLTGPLGSGFSLAGKNPLLVGGGIGIAPLFYLAKSMKSLNPRLLIGASCREEMHWPKLFDEVCEKIYITTDDGSLGVRGFTTALLPEVLAAEKVDVIYSCGPEMMMKKTAETAKTQNIDCYVSLESYMACGLGACLSCTFTAKNGQRVKVCTDGPVFDAKEVF